MKTSIRAFIFFLSFLVFAGTSLAQHQITQWPDNKKGGVSLTFDDGCPSQISLGIPALNERGLKGTFFLISDYVSVWDAWRDAANMGHEIGSHTKTHPFLTSLSLAQVQNEVFDSKTAIEAQIPNQKCLSFAYPYGDLNNNVESIVDDVYIGARGVICGLNSEPFDFYNLAACSLENKDKIYAQADAAVQQQKWLVVFFHSLNGGNDCWGTRVIGDLTNYLDYLQTKNLWVGTFGAMVKYIKERESATLSVVSSSSDQIVLSLTDILNDATYDQPLTIRSEVPSGWANVTVQQGTGITTVKSVVEGAATVIYYNAIPDRGSILIKEASMGPILSSLSPSSATAGGSAFTLTVSGSGFINGSVVRWNGSDRTTTYVSASQLTAAITTADIATAGTASVTVFNPAPGGGTSGALTFTIQAPIPTLTLSSLSPSSATAGGAAFILTVSGSGFINRSVVRWNGSDRTTTYVSASKLTAAISAADIATAGTTSVTVFNPGSNGGTSGTLTFTIQAFTHIPPSVLLLLLDDRNNDRAR